MQEDEDIHSEIEDIILFHLFKGDEKYNYEDITYLPSHYSIEIDKDELKRICTKLGDERKLNWKENPERVEAKLLPAGHKYALEKLQPLVANQQQVPFERFTAILKELNRIDDFELLDENNKEGLSVNFTPKGKFSENYFRVIRMKFLYYAVTSNPKVRIERKREFEAVLQGFKEWISLLKENGTTTTTSTTTQRVKERQPITFAVGAYWSGDDQTQRFLKDGVWENGKDEGDEGVMDEVRKGDTFVLKSSFSKDGSSILRIKGIGKVISKKPHGVFEVEWNIKDITIDIENLGFYRKTIEQIKHDDWVIIDSRLRQHFAKNSNVKLQCDSVSNIDLLGRKPFVKAIADYVSRLWEQQEEYAYTIHLSGEWGSGKSNVLKFLSQDLEGRGWYVLHYNAWEYQHIENPWWIFSNKIYKQILTKLTWRRALRFRLKEFWWRLFVINKLNWISFVFIGVLAIIFWWITISSTQTSDGQSQKPDWLSLIGTILTTGGSLWLLFKGITGSLLPASDESAQNFQKNINDPIDLVKGHFQSMIKFPSKNIAVFIDDIDRCSSKNVVRLLEGIQTIFKSSKVLYVFAGDAGWVRRCFEIEYEGFAEDFKKPGHTLGNFFVEKVFQMSVAIPVVTQNALKSFLKQTLSPVDKLSSNVKSVESISSDFSLAKNEIDIETALSKYRGTQNETVAIEAAIERLSSNETLDDLEHDLEAYHSLLPGNVRSVKRFINNYAIARQTLLLQRVSLTDVPMDVLVRWLILTSKYPLLAEELAKRPALVSDYFNSPYKEIFESSEFRELSNNILVEDKIRLIVGK